MKSRTSSQDQWPGLREIVVRPFERLEWLAENLNTREWWGGWFVPDESDEEARKQRAQMVHDSPDGARRYGAWCAAAAVLRPSMPLRGLPLDGLTVPRRSNRHIRRHRKKGETLFRRIAPATVRRFQRLARIAPVYLWLDDPCKEEREAAHRRLDQARRGGNKALVTVTRVVAEALRLRLPTAPVVRGTVDPRGEVVEAIWRLLGDPDADRLKWCPQCAAWFVDRARNVRATYCSRRCTNRAWNRAARRAAQHKQYRPKRRVDIINARIDRRESREKRKAR